MLPNILYAKTTCYDDVATMRTNICFSAKSFYCRLMTKTASKKCYGHIIISLKMLVNSLCSLYLHC